MGPPRGDGAKKQHPGKSIFSGAISGGVEICLTYPTEYVKTQMQLYEKMGKMGPLQVAKQTMASKGVAGLYRGLSSLLYFSIPKSAVRFAAFEQARNLLQDPQTGKMTATKNFAAGLAAGVCEAVAVVTPMETIKVKLIHDQLSEQPKYKGFFHGVSTIANQNGISGCYKGLGPTIIKQGSNQAIRFMVYYDLKRIMLGDDPKAQFSTVQSLFAGVLAGAASVFGNTPIDVVKTRMQGLESHKYKNALDCAFKIWKHEGVKGFYKGTVPRLGRVCLDVAIVMTLYDKILQALDYVWKTE